MPKQKAKNQEREMAGHERLSEKRGPGSDVTVGMLKIIALKDFTGAGMDMIEGGTYNVPSQKGFFFCNAGLAKAVVEPKEYHAPNTKDVKGPKVRK